MSRTRRAGVLRSLGATLPAFLMATCALAPSAPAPPTLSPQRIAPLIASPDRSAADRTNDLRRKPEAMLAFIGIRPGMTAPYVSAGGGYTSELLARVIGPNGTVYGQSQPRDPSCAPPAPAAPEGTSHPTPTTDAAPAPVPSPPPPQSSPPRTAAVAFAERDSRLRSANVAAAAIVPVTQRFDDPVPPALAAERLDLVALMFNYQDLGFKGVDRARMNLAVFRALKPGGAYVIADHAGRPGTGNSEAGSVHRIEEAFLHKEIEAAGFSLPPKRTSCATRPTRRTVTLPSRHSRRTSSC